MDFGSAAKPLFLDYAPAPGRALRFIRKAIRIILLCAVVVTAYIWGPPAWHQTRMLYWQRQCMKFAAPVDQVVYDGEVISGRTIAPPTCWAEFVDSAAHVGPALASLPNYGSLVFLGELKTPSGESRLVAVAFTSQVNWWLHGYLSPGMSYQVWVLKPGSAFSPPELISQNSTLSIDVASSNAQPLPRFYFGQRDPADPSRFTVRYRVSGQEDVVDGRIDDTGQITLTQQMPPTP